RLRELRVRGLQRLVRDIDAQLERGKRRIGEAVPPGAADVGVTRLRGLPVLDLLERGHRGRRRRLVARLRRAGRNGEKSERDRRRERHGRPAVADGAAATRTVCPGDSESGGLLTTRSVPSRPERISTVSPKSRPLVTVTSAMRFCASTVATCR